MPPANNPVSTRYVREQPLPETPAIPTGRLETTSSTVRLYWVAAIAILALAAFLRLWRLDLVQFKDDQATLLRLAEDLVRLGRVPLAGMTSSIGVPLPGTFEYVLAPFVAVSRDPRVATGAIALANVAAVAGTMVFGWRRFSPLTGLLAGLVYAANPWAVFFSRKVWSNDVLAPMAVVLLFCLDNAVVGKRAWWGAAAFPVFALGVAFHPSFALLAPLLVALGVVLVRRRQFTHVAIGLGLAALLAVPYLIYNLQTQWSYLGALQSALTLPSRIDREGPGDVIGLIGGWDNWYVEGLHLEYLLSGRIASAPGRIETLFLALGGIAALMLVFRARSVDHSTRVRAAGLLSWVLVPMLLTIRHSVPLYDYYFLFILPAGALLIGLGIHTLANLVPSRRAGRLLVGAALAAIVGVASIQSVLVLRQLGYLADNYVPYYGLSLRAAEQLTGELLQLADRNGGQQLSVEVDDTANDVSIGYLARPYVPEVQVVARRRGPWNVDFDLPGASGGAPYALSATPLLVPPQTLGVSYADGVKVLSASTMRTVDPGESVGVALIWTVDQPSAAPLTNRLLWQMSLYNASNDEVGRQAGLPHDWGELSPGKVVVSWITVPTARETAEGAYQVRLSRLDPVTRQPVAANGAGGEWDSGKVEVRRS
jgi:hypothetical protein